MNATRRLLARGLTGAILLGSMCSAAGAQSQEGQVPEAPVRPVISPLPVSATEASRTMLHASMVKAKPKPKVTKIAKYAYCGSAVRAAQRCIDQGKLTLYYPAGVKTLAGHNYMGWYWLDDLPVGRKVVIASGSLKGSYRVYGHGWAKRGSQGGTFPKSGLKAAVALQTCTSNGTGFSFLKRI